MSSNVHYERPKIKTYQQGDVRRYAHMKRDGIMLTVDTYRDPIRCLTRHPDGAHDIASQLELDPLNLLRDSMWRGVMFCELYSRWEPASQVKSHIASGDMSKLRIECFAVPSDPSDKPLGSLRDMCHIVGMPFIEFKLWSDWECDNDGRTFNIDEDEYEGIVFKDGNLLNWCKWKPVLTTDLVVLGFKDGRGKYLGTLGALELGLADGTHVCNCSGMDDATRDLISENEDEWLGKVVEVAYQRLDSGGGLRHPRFVRRRDDKGATECQTI